MKNLKKIAITGLCAATLMAGLTGCAKKDETPTDDPTTNTGDVTGGDVVVAEDIVSAYTITNKTGQKVTELYIYLAGSEDKGANLAVDGLEADATVVVDANTAELFANVPADNTDVFVLEFVCEDGYTGTFETLHRDVAAIDLLSADAAAGATAIAFPVTTTEEVTDEATDNVAVEVESTETGEAEVK